MPRRLGDILKRRVLRDLARKADTQAAVREIWESIVPERFRGHAHAVCFRRRVVEVAVSSPAVLAELQGFYGRQVEAALRERFPGAGLAPPVRIKYMVEEQ